MTPIRLNRPYWYVPILCLHRCDEHQCAVTQDFVDDGNEIIINLRINENYENGRCEKYDTLTKSHVNISEYDPAFPTTSHGVLYNPDMTIIPMIDQFALWLSFPFLEPFEITVRDYDSQGLSLRHVLFLLQGIYKNLYEEEEKTSTPQIFSVDLTCLECTNLNSNKVFSTEEVLDEVVLENCSICHNQCIDKVKTGMLHCGHFFHKECIQQWISRGKGQTCPLCRASLLVCDCVRGVRRVDVEYTVLPRELSLQGCRNTTDGLYKIYDYYYEELCIESLVYNNIQHTLYINFTQN